MSHPDPNSTPEPDLATFARQLSQWSQRAAQAQGKAAQAFARLLQLAESSDSGQADTIARFLASTWDGTAYPFDPFELRAVDIEISDDMLACLDALRWAKCELHELVPGGTDRVRLVLRKWQIQPSAEL